MTFTSAYFFCLTAVLTSWSTSPQNLHDIRIDCSSVIYQWHAVLLLLLVPFQWLTLILCTIKTSLTLQALRELENDGWINRQIYQEIPPRVEYTLTELAESFVPILEQMKEWSETHLC